jgi:hypothetical protein|uniref:Uncharacterized protein n=1 Tax=Zea mays TaxID=4577 RepID=B4FZJ3_MAIZE|nr:unknown [Zea mays]
MQIVVWSQAQEGRLFWPYELSLAGHRNQDIVLISFLVTSLD